MNRYVEAYEERWDGTRPGGFGECRFCEEERDRCRPVPDGTRYHVAEVSMWRYGAAEAQRVATRAVGAQMVVSGYGWTGSGKLDGKMVWRCMQDVAGCIGARARQLAGCWSLLGRACPECGRDLTVVIVESARATGEAMVVRCACGFACSIAVGRSASPAVPSEVFDLCIRASPSPAPRTVYEIGVKDGRGPGWYPREKWEPYGWRYVPVDVGRGRLDS